MDNLLALVHERNWRETFPFLAIHEANNNLQSLNESLQLKSDQIERELVAQQERMESLTPLDGHATQSMALQNETRLREKLEKLQEELNDNLKEKTDDQATALQTAKRLSEAKDLSVEQETNITTLQNDISTKERMLEHMRSEVEDSQSRMKLAEQQYVGLKDTIRLLQEDNDSYQKSHQTLETRFINEKETMSTEMNQLTEMVDRLKKEAEMLRSMNKQEEKRTSWFGLSKPVEKKQDTSGEEDARKFGSLGVVLPTAPKHKVLAHTSEGYTVRYDGSGSDFVATCSAGATIKIWETATGTMKAKFKAGGSNAILDCDLSNGIVAGGGTDKMCRVWNVETQRMLHQLVGHLHKVTCVKLFGGEKGVITGSADRSIKIWDISRQTYRQTTTLRHTSTANCIDVTGSDPFGAVTAHLDGGVRMWDMRTGGRSADVGEVHDGAVSSVQFCPTDSTKVLTNGMDSCLKVLDMRTGGAVHKIQHPEFHTSYSWSSAAYSPNGSYVSSISSSSGAVFVWDSESGDLKVKLEGHEAGGCGIAWGLGGDTGQQVASLDKKGRLILWA